MSEKVDLSDMTDEERKQKGIETEDEALERVKKQAKEKTMSKKAKKPKTKAEKIKKPKAEKKPAKKKSPKSEGREYRRHKGTEKDPLTGQSAPKTGKLEREDLNDTEKEILASVNRSGGKPVSIKDLAERVLSQAKIKEQGTLAVRNALRRLVREKFIKKAEPGLYKAA